ncbi:MAG: ABC transporter substrate-binding protein [Acidobacteriota bacterium]
MIIPALRDMGLIEDQNLAVEWRFAEGNIERLPNLASELVGLGVRVIVAPTNLEAEIVRRYTKSIPIMMLYAVEPVRLGFARSISQPGSNVTGVMYADASFIGKTLQILQEVKPDLKRAGAIFIKSNRGLDYFSDPIVEGRKLGISYTHYPISDHESIGTALASIKKQGVQALRITTGGPITPALDEILAFTTANRILTIFSTPIGAERGGLFSYSPYFPELFIRAARMLARLIQGEQPEKMAFEYPTRYEFIVNQKAARQMQLALPGTILVRADRAIE